MLYRLTKPTDASAVGAVLNFGREERKRTKKGRSRTHVALRRVGAVAEVSVPRQDHEPERGRLPAGDLFRPTALRKDALHTRAPARPGVVGGARRGSLLCPRCRLRRAVLRHD